MRTSGEWLAGASPPSSVRDTQNPVEGAKTEGKTQ